jgi:serine/threonine-protein kinase RsbW
MPASTVRSFRVKNALAEVERANAELRDLWLRCALPEDVEVPVSICLEEALSNVIRHGCVPGRDYDIRVSYILLERGPGGIEVEISDDAPAFDPLALPPPSLEVPLEERKPGGMGVFMIRQMMDEVRYERRDGRNHFVFRKYFQNTAG